MESTRDEPTDGDHVDLRDIDRAAAAPFLEYPSLPVWWPVVAGAWFTAVFSAGFTGWISNTGVRAAVTVSLVAALAFFLRWYMDRRGVMPSSDPRVAPTEIGRAMWWYYAGAIACALVIAACFLWAPPVVAAVATFILATVGIAVYDRAYHRAADQVRSRLG